MSIRLGGFTCDSCVIFHKYTGGRCNGVSHEETLPDGWKLYVDKEEYKNYTDSLGVYNSEWINVDIISKNLLLCDKCSTVFERKNKIKRIKEKWKKN